MSGGSLSWQSVASVTVTASGSSSAFGSLTGYEYRLSTDSGATWGAATPGASVVISAEGETLVQFRALDDAGNTGAWARVGHGGVHRVRIDRTPPAPPPRCPAGRRPGNRWPASTSPDRVRRARAATSTAPAPTAAPAWSAAVPDQAST
ncbi:MAG: hypothetical protein U0Y82_05105 [Thermoleophilia bacterium]